MASCKWCNLPVVMGGNWEWVIWGREPECILDIDPMPWYLVRVYLNLFTTFGSRRAPESIRYNVFVNGPRLFTRAVVDRFTPYDIGLILISPTNFVMKVSNIFSSSQWRILLQLVKVWCRKINVGDHHSVYDSAYLVQLVLKWKFQK